MKVGYTVTFHHSDHIRPNGRHVVNSNINSFYDNCKYNFESFVIDNESVPRDTFNSIFDLDSDRYKNLKYTYIEDQNIKGITGAWSLGIKQAIDAGCDIIILTTDDVIIDSTINNLIKHIELDIENNNNAIYGPVGRGVNVPLQTANEPTGKILEIEGKVCPYHLGGHMYAFTKEFYHKWAKSNGDLFVINHRHNGGDGKWGGSEGNAMCWAEEGAKCFIVGTCWIDHTQHTRYSWKTAKYIDNGEIDKVIQHYTDVGDTKRVTDLQKSKKHLK